MAVGCKKLAIFILLVSLFCSLLCLAACTANQYNTYEQPRPSSSAQTTHPQPPQQPTNFIGTAISCNVVNLQWADNSFDEDGFRIYRNNSVIANVGTNISTYQDTGLEANTTYHYSILAYNQSGDSIASLLTLKTPNPPITVRLDGIGVYDNRENWTRGEDGEIYIYVVVSDGINSTGILRFPQIEGQHYKLAKNETVSLGTTVFSENEVGDYLTLTIIGYEDDGGGFEPLVYQALDIAIESQLPTGTPLLLGIFDTSLVSLIGQFFGEEDDWLGSFEYTWDSTDNWGIGNYQDIPCEDERGTQCLRLWFSISSE